MGLPLPKGKIRVYKADEDDALEFIGEDKIDHTPKDEKVRVFLGNAFDLVGERVHQSTKKLSKRSREEIYKIVLKNHKEKSVDIIAVEHFWGDWVIQQNSHPYKKKDANTAEFKVNVPADGEVSIAYTVLLTW